MERVLSQLDVVEEYRAHISTAVCLPREYFPHEVEDGGWLVSPYVPGWSLDELLIRGGRLPWRVAGEIGRCVLQGVEELEQAGLVHGDISLRNIRLQADGQAVLVNPFTARLLRPSIGFRADLQLREVQHMAPELVGSGRRHDPVSDLYSVGTVLWQLLTARPASISADPVTFLMQCRDRDVDDVRRWVPDCSEDVAREIRRLTRRRPELRASSAAAAFESWCRLAGSSVAATKSLLKRLPDRKHISVPPKPSLRRRRLLTPASAAAALTVGVMLGLSSNLIPLPLNLRRSTASVQLTETPLNPATEELPLPAPVDEVLPLPEISPDGLLRLTGGQRYTARSLQHAGTLRVDTEGDGLAVIEVTGAPAWNIAADQLQMSGVQVVSRSDTPSSARQLLEVRCQLLELDRVIVGQRTEPRATGLRWSPGTAGSSVVRLTSTVVLAGRFGIHTTSPPGRFELDNVLFEGTETAWRCDTRHPGRVLLKTSQVTQRGGSSFADVIHSGGSGGMQMELSCGESVLAAEEAIVRLASSDPQWTPADVRVAFRLPSRSNPTIMQPNVTQVVWFDPSLKQKVALAETQVISESLLMADPEFDSSASDESSFSAARLLDFDGPKRGPRLPGVDVTRLPQLPGGK